MTRVERVLDASVLVAFLLREEVEGAEEACSGETAMAAPELIRLELASAVAKAVWRGRLTQSAGAGVVAAVDDVVDTFVPLAALAPQAFALAARLRCSAYDGSYLALAMERNTVVVTSDRRFAERAISAGLAQYVQRVS